ncbi:hypothetical protein EDB84DRAFT_1611451 [Lactarius hengduanensis]|nr:hypothetical protein EDB84DRAFT_1611451 [Lactarius hengduanensis]
MAFLIEKHDQQLAAASEPTGSPHRDEPMDVDASPPSHSPSSSDGHASQGLPFPGEVVNGAHAVAHHDITNLSRTGLRELCDGFRLTKTGNKTTLTDRLKNFSVDRQGWDGSGPSRRFAEDDSASQRQKCCNQSNVKVHPRIKREHAEPSVTMATATYPIACRLDYSRVTSVSASVPLQTLCHPLRAASPIIHIRLRSAATPSASAPVSLKPPNPVIPAPRDAPSFDMADEERLLRDIVDKALAQGV